MSKLQPKAEKTAKTNATTTVNVQVKERNWTLKLIDKVLGRNPELKDVVIETTCLKSFASKGITGSLDTCATLLQDGVIKAFVVGNPHNIKKQVFQNGKPVNGQFDDRVAYSIKLIGLDISKESTRTEYDNDGNETGTRTFRWFNRVYNNLMEQREFEEQIECFEGITL